MTVHNITVTELSDIIKSDSLWQLLDVREADEYEFAHIPDSKHIPLHELGHRYHELDANKKIVAICHHGIRSLHAADFLVAQGFDQVFNLLGGIDAWSRECDSSIPRY